MCVHHCNKRFVHNAMESPQAEYMIVPASLNKYHKHMAPARNWCIVSTLTEH